MKSKLLNRDYPLSETKMSNDEKKKKASDVKSSVSKKIQQKKDMATFYHEEEMRLPEGSRLGDIMHKKYIEEIKK